jgi:glyoxylase-like metal-dependent hydrolase (beta-lactamase superfamily II)
VSVFPTEPSADPLADWLQSCRKLRDLLPADCLVLPAHNEPFFGAHKRLEALMAGHETALERVLLRLDPPKRAIDLFGAMFARAIDRDTLGMATGETIAHLNCLIGRGQVIAETSDGITLYRRVS